MLYLYNILDIMTKEKIVLLPKMERILKNFGTNIKLARLRRRYSTVQVSERSDISRSTLLSIEKGLSSVSIGSYLKVLMVLGLEEDILEVAKDDVLGRKLQDANLYVKRRAPRSRT